MIIGIFGQMHNGKSTFAKMLVESLNTRMRYDATFSSSYAFRIASFARSVKYEVGSKYGVTLEDIEKWKNNPEKYPGWNVSMRECLQREAQLGRDIKPTVWINRTITAMYPIVIDDGRYINEAEVIKSNKGYNILIFRDGFYNDSEHESEKAIGDLFKSILNGKDNPNIALFNHLICNTTLDELRLVAEQTTDMILTHFRNVNEN